MYYYDKEWTCWVRRLLTLSSCVIDVTLTGEWEEVREERLRVHNARERQVDLHDHLPPDVMVRMCKHLGYELAIRLGTHNYVGELGVKNVVAANLRWAGEGGVPAAFVRECTETVAA